MTQVTINQPVADFEAPATGDKTIKLSDYAGQFVLIYFYPRDNTAGCTQQAQNFRDARVIAYAAMTGLKPSTSCRLICLPIKMRHYARLLK